MPSERERRALLGILENAEAALEFTKDLSFATFETDRRTLYAVVRCLEIISETSRRVGPDVRGRHPQIPWRQIADAGNVYRHRYDNVSASLVRGTAEECMTEIIAVCRTELAGGGSDVKTRYDPEADALYLRLADDRIVESEEVRAGIVLDYDAQGRLVGIEILDASEHIAAGADLAALAAA
ncbi:DUF2283 domain-containing protein [Methylobacterium segetis]|uniref:DUF2283 domain-containing protein n=1 Tax=Methylobacterium segetis TaxID=2488750 RepID=UPI001FE1010A|nr:DUF2283 domain-containing protein [Methylobacterium segetis]